MFICYPNYKISTLSNKSAYFMRPTLTTPHPVLRISFAICGVADIHQRRKIKREYGACIPILVELHSNDAG